MMFLFTDEELADLLQAITVSMGEGQQGSLAAEAVIAHVRAQGTRECSPDTIDALRALEAELAL